MVETVETFFAFRSPHPRKAAQHILAESQARNLGPKRVRAASLIIDAVSDVPWAPERYASKGDDFLISPTSIAVEAWHLAHQPHHWWSFLAEVRPFNEPW